MSDLIVTEPNLTYYTNAGEIASWWRENSFGRLEASFIYICTNTFDRIPRDSTFASHAGSFQNNI